MVDFPAHSYVRSQRIGPIGRFRSLLTTVVIYSRSSDPVTRRNSYPQNTSEMNQQQKNPAIFETTICDPQAPWQHHHFEATFHKAPRGRQGLFGYQKWKLFQWFCSFLTYIWLMDAMGFVIKLI